MQRQSFTNALRATAKIACAASLLNVSCKSKTPTEVATPSQNIDSVGQEEQTSSAFTEQTDLPSEQSVDGDPTEAQYTECQPIITKAFSDESFPMPNEVSEEVKDCCALTAAYYDALSAKTSDFNLAMDWEN